MSRFSDYDKYDALGMAELVRNGEVTATELCEAAIGTIERLNPEMNAVVTPMFDQGRDAAVKSLPEGPFSGVPFLIKDLGYAYAGVPMSQGCKALKDFVPDHDDEMVTRLKKSGVVTLGKTNTPEFGLMGVTEPELFGPCRNPWNQDHTPGGSSGGSAAAVAAGMVPFAAGGDGGGSIRIPASCCGLFGLKPTRGRNPSGPDHGRVWQGAVQEHVLTRTVRDSAAMLDQTQGADIGAPYEIRPPEASYLSALAEEPSGLKIAFSTHSPLETPVHPDCVRAVEETARLLEEIGHHVEEAGPNVDGLALAKSYMSMYFGEVAADIAGLAKLLGRKAKMGQFFKSYDLYLTPTIAYPPAKIGELQPKPAEVFMMKSVNALKLGWLLKASGMVDQMATRSLERTPFTQVANLCGLPAMSVPQYWNTDGLPCGSQFIARFGDEITLFKLAAQLEKARPWFDKRPPVI
ncbi:MAG: amidase [Deltaproteobacteria bacterium]|nr:amidase [Deltaproteobacteria bacterium]